MKKINYLLILIILLIPIFVQAEDCNPNEVIIKAITIKGQSSTAEEITSATIDKHTINLLKQYLSFNNIDNFNPIFLVNHRILVSAQINQILKAKLEELHLPAITFHALRHTHASVLLYKGVSVLSVSKRLGHSNITTTQSTYLHIIKELEAQDQSQIIKIIGIVDN